MKETYSLGIGIVGMFVAGVGLYKHLGAKKEVEDVKEQLHQLSHCHNAFCLYQEEQNREVNQRLDDTQEEIISTFEHIECLVDELM